MREALTLVGEIPEVPVHGGPIIDLSELESPVTIIAAMRESDDAILIASDSEITDDTGLKDQDAKLQKIKGAPIAWACSGNDTITSDFNSWLKSYTWPPTDWAEFRDKAIEELSRLNGRQRELAKLAGEEWEPGYGGSCLLAGWINDEPQILELNDKGQATRYWKEGFHAIGTGGGVARVANKLLRSVTSPEPPEEKLLFIMQFTATTAPKCGPPIVGWRVTREGVTNIGPEAS